MTTTKKPIQPEIEENLDDFVDSLSLFLDDSLFEPLYEYFREQRPLVGVLSEQLSDLKSFRKIDQSLRMVKVVCMILTIIFFFSSIRYFIFGYAAKGIVYIVACVDLARISGNCFLKYYITQAIDELSGLQDGGSVAKISSTLFKMAKVAAGVAGAEDPIKNMKKNVQWNVIFNGTMIKFAFTTLLKIFKK